jgi:hypothetical protein
MRKYIPRIISAVVGLALVGYGGWLSYAGHGDTGGPIILGGLGTLGLPALVGGKKGGES